jgi:hypothetical protein
MDPKNTKIVIPAIDGQRIFEAIAEKDPKSYETVGKLFNDLCSMIAVAGISLPEISRESEYIQRIQELEETIKKLRNESNK